MTSRRGAAPDLVAEVLAIQTSQSPPLPIVSTGFVNVDAGLGGGIRGEQVTLIGGLAGVGKSVFALGIARRSAYEHGLRTVFLAPFTPRRELLVQVVAAESRVSVGHLRSGSLDERDHRSLGERRERLSSSDLVLDGGWRRPTTAEAVVNAVQQWISEGVRVIVIDGVDRAEATLLCMVRSLRLIARQFQVAVVVVTTAAVPAERYASAPRFEDLREYSAVADLADLVIMLHREDLNEPDSLRPGEADVAIVKHRYGPQRSSTILFQGHYARFVDFVR